MLGDAKFKMLFRNANLLPAGLFAAALVVTSPSSAVSGAQSLASTDRPATPAKAGESPSPSERRPASFDGQHADYAMVTSNTVFGSMTEKTQRIFEDLHGPGRDFLSGNKFWPWQGPHLSCPAPQRKRRACPSLRLDLASSPLGGANGDAQSFGHY